MADYNEAEDLINIGAYTRGSNKDIDNAINKINKINSFLRQETQENFEFEDTLKIMQDIFES